MSDLTTKLEDILDMAQGSGNKPGRKLDAFVAIQSIITQADQQGYERGYNIQLRKDNNFIKTIQAQARREELEAIASYEPVSEGFDYRKYARDRLAGLTKGGKDGE